MEHPDVNRKEWEDGLVERLDALSQRRREYRPQSGEWPDKAGHDPELLEDMLSDITGESNKAQLDEWIKMIQAGKDPFEGHESRKPPAGAEGPQA